MQERLDMVTGDVNTVTIWGKMCWEEVTGVLGEASGKHMDQKV